MGDVGVVNLDVGERASLPYAMFEGTVQELNKAPGVASKMYGVESTVYENSLFNCEVLEVEYEWADCEVLEVEYKWVGGRCVGWLKCEVHKLASECCWFS